MNTHPDAEGSTPGSGVVLPGISDPSQLLHAAAERLATDFAGHFAAQTIGSG